MVSARNEYLMSIEYSPVTPRIVAELRRIVGDRYVIHGDAEKLTAFSHDAIADPHYAHMPEVAVRPAGAEEIAAIMKLANRERIPVTPRGAGSGLSGGAVPLYGGIVLLNDRMNRILEIDRENLMVVVEPGVITNEINERLKEFGLFYPGYPMSLEMCYIGGNVAENAGGGKAVKYGVTARYVMGIEMVTPKGEIVEFGGKRVKDVTGYNMLQLMVGSEGTLGIFTRITLKLLPLPKSAVSLLCLFPSAAEAISAVPRIMTGSGIIPTAIEFMDRQCVQISCDYLNESIPREGAGAMLLMTVDGAGEDQVEREYDLVGEMALRGGAFQVYVADNATTAERIWRVRRGIPEALNLITPNQSSEDIVVPMARIPKLIEAFEVLGARYGVRVPCYGHAGDGNMHSHVLADPSWSSEHWAAICPRILTDLYKLTASLGGTLSGEHGIGHKRKRYMPLVVSEPALEMMRAVKLALDPNLVLNPGKIFDFDSP